MVCSMMKWQEDVVELEVETARAYLVEQGLVDADDTAVEALGGGVPRQLAVARPIPFPGPLTSARLSGQKTQGRQACPPSYALSAVNS